MGGVGFPSTGHGRSRDFGTPSRSTFPVVEGVWTPTKDGSRVTSLGAGPSDDSAETTLESWVHPKVLASGR